MKYSKEEIEKRLRSLLGECLESMNQESAIEKLEYNEETEKCTVTLSTHIVEEDDYIGFEGY